MPVTIPTLTGVIPEPAERAIRALKDAVDSLQTQQQSLAGRGPDAQVLEMAAALRELTDRVNILARQVDGLLNP